MNVETLRAQAALKGPAAAPAPAVSGTSGTGFSDVLKAQNSKLHFSAHARSRLTSRNISMTPDILGRLEGAVEGAAKKGSRDSLVLLSDLAFIVNVPNRTVVTAMDGRSMKQNVVTNIDSTVLA